MSTKEGRPVQVVTLASPQARRSLLQVYKLLLAMADDGNTDAPAKSAGTGAGADDGSEGTDRQLYHTPTTEEEQVSGAASTS